MGFTVYYRSTRPIAAPVAAALERSTDELSRGRTWLSCEPVHFFPESKDGHLLGGSKPNFQPHPDDVASAAREGLPDGTTLDMLDVLCQLSRNHGIDWEISHDHSDGPVGYIRSGVCDKDVVSQVEAFAEVGDILRAGNDGEGAFTPASQGTAPTSQGISVRVIGLMSPGSVRVVVGQGVGLLDGGNEQTWPIEWVPASARRPNGEFRISGFKAGMPQVVVGPEEV